MNDGTADIYGGVFDSQPQVFAHLWEKAGPGYIADRVEVIANQDPTRRLRHWFAEDDAQAIEDELGMFTTCVIVFANAGVAIGEGTDRLVYLGTFAPLRTLP